MPLFDCAKSSVLLFFLFFQVLTYKEVNIKPEKGGTSVGCLKVSIMSIVLCCVDVR
jgi:hypothetical protein